MYKRSALLILFLQIGSSLQNYINKKKRKQLLTTIHFSIYKNYLQKFLPLYTRGQSSNSKFSIFAQIQIDSTAFITANLESFPSKKNRSRSQIHSSIYYSVTINQLESLQLLHYIRSLKQHSQGRVAPLPITYWNILYDCYVHIMRRHPVTCRTCTQR